MGKCHILTNVPKYLAYMYWFSCYKVLKFCIEISRSEFPYSGGIWSYSTRFVSLRGPSAMKSCKISKLNVLEKSLSRALWKGGLMHLRKVSTHVSQRSPRRLTWAETFRYFWIFCMSEHDSTHDFAECSTKSSFIDSCSGDVSIGMMRYGDALRPPPPLLPVSGFYVC